MVQNGRQIWRKRAYQHSALPSCPNHAEFGNVVSKKTLLTNSPQTMQQNRSLPATTLDESSNSTNPTSSTSSISSDPKSSTVMQNVAKSDIPSSIDNRLLPDSSTASGCMLSNHTRREVDCKSVDGVCKIGPPRLSSSLSSLPSLTPSVSSSLNS